MGDEYRLAEWSIRLVPEQAPIVYHRLSNDEIATVHGSSELALERARLIARAPSLEAAVRAAAEVFAAMKEHGTDREREVGADMLPSMEAALYGLGHTQSG